MRAAIDKKKMEDSELSDEQTAEFIEQTVKQSIDALFGVTK
jgi:hypothetical protein